MSADRTRRRRRRARRRTRRALSLTAWRAVIVGQAMRDLARHGRLHALAALVLGAASEIRDRAIFGDLAGGGLAEKAVRGRLVRDPEYTRWLWEECKRIRDEVRAEEAAADPGEPSV